MDVGGGEDRLGRGGGDRPVEPASDFPLAGGVVSVWNRFHSKSPRSAAVGSVQVDPICRKRREIADFSPAARTRPATSSRVGHGGANPRRMRKVTWPWP